MRLPTLNEIATSRDFVAEFKGYNHNLQIGEGEFYDMKNLTSTYYPILSPRPKRGTYVKAGNPQGMIAKDALCYVDGTKFVINEHPIEMGLNDEPKQLVSMGAYVIIMPDKKYINTLDYTDKGDIEAEFVTTDDVTFSLCMKDGANYENIAETKPEDPKNMDLWIDTSSTPHSLKQYSETSATWVTVPTTYVKISSPGIGTAFKQFDGVTISGINAEELQSLNATMVLWECNAEEDYIVVIGMLDVVKTQTVAEGAITVSRKMPNIDFITESENRLWGCRYGTSVDGEVVNEIYSSKLGDFKNWNCFMGLSTDSYTASCGTDGLFTGAITHLGYPLFFKENYVHKVYGNYPANFQIQTTACRGVQKGCSDSLAIVNEVLYYKSRNGVCAYDGSLPVEISYVLGEESYGDAVAVAHGNKYYISMKDAKGEYTLFVYDTSKRLWHKEDNLAVKKFCSCRNELYCIPQNSTEIKTMLGSGTVDAEPIKWQAESGILGLFTPDKKYISRLNVRMSLDVGTEVNVYVQYDSSGEWEFASRVVATSIRSFSMSIRPRRCDHFRFKIEGEGNGKIYSISKTLEQGSDLR